MSKRGQICRGLVEEPLHDAAVEVSGHLLSATMKSETGACGLRFLTVFTGPMYGLKIVMLEDFELGSMAFFKLGVDFGLKI